MTGSPKPPSRLLVAGAALVVLAAGIQAAASIFAPLLLALFVTVLCLPLLNWMTRRGLPTSLAIVIILVGLVSTVMLITGLLGQSLVSFQSKLPDYIANLRGVEAELFKWLKDHQIDVQAPIEQFDGLGKAMRFIGSALGQLSSLLSSGLLVLLAVAFMLGEVAGFPAKLAATSTNGHAASTRLQAIVESVNQYIVLKTVVSLATFVAVWLLLRLVGVDFPVLWAAVAFLLNYVPNIGSVLAAIPPVLLALVQPGLGIGAASTVTIGFVAINIVLGSVVEPRLMGSRLGVSTLVVFASLIIWGWLLGPVGMVLSVPLTITLKIALESSAETRPIAIWLSDRPPEPKSPPDAAPPTA